MPFFTCIGLLSRRRCALSQDVIKKSNSTTRSPSLSTFAEMVRFCREELPEVNQFLPKNLKGTGVTFKGVDVDEDEVGLEFQKQLGLEFQ
ncbi:hypothetical protein OH492_14240 [Vibrio chagasii]|nr:hypothetical protein [Vibrio chagasii]